MGRYASYYAVQNDVIEQISKLTDEEVVDFLVEDFTSSDYVEIDKMWDGLHFLLANAHNLEGTEKKRSLLQMFSSKKTKNNLVEPAIFGEKTIYPDPVVAITDSELVSKIAALFETIDINGVLDGYDGKAFEEADIYPVVIWTREDANDIKQDLLEAFNTLKNFYVAASNRNDSVIVYLG
ncbi:DUF1877 family protein [Mollicutes bacterium LVI A0039]|nr:DUF1877 family protein [Mollicutes bacterium LVI A0039]